MELNLKGQSFGFLRAEEKTPYKEDRYTVWRCHCTNCGKEAFVNTKRLKRGTVTSCGCIPKTTSQSGSIAEDLEGQTFGDLKILHRAENHRNGRTQWLCECVCKKQVVVTAHELKTGHTKSCGCYKKKNPSYALDLTNRPFGRLTALYPTGQRDYKGSVMWRCRCRCGSELEISADSLVHGNYRSCGCLKKEIEKNIGSTLHMVSDTCVEWLEKRKHRSDNTSGFRGVYLLRNRRYRVSIGLQKQRYHIGTFYSFDEAVEARLEIEQILHDGFVEAYYLWEECAVLDPAWAEAHPFYYDVEKVNGEFVISTTGLHDDVPKARDTIMVFSAFNRQISLPVVGTSTNRLACSAVK